MFEEYRPRPTFAWGALLLALVCLSGLSDGRARLAEEPVRAWLATAMCLVGLALAWALWQMKPWALDAYATWAKVLFGVTVGATAVRADGPADVVVAAIVSVVKLSVPYVLEDGRRLELRARERWLQRHGVA